jgi:hypothetical protein
MNTTAKVVLSSTAGFFAGYLLAAIAGFAKFIALGKAEFSGDATILSVPVMHIENHAKGFALGTRYGVIVFGLAAAIAAGTAAIVRSGRTLHATKHR